VNPPTVSVLIPTFDRLAFLREAVASVRAQTFEDWELIVVDDGSTDGTVAWLEGLDDARVHVVPLDHTGNLAALRNRGVERARGRYVAFLDSDDSWEPEKLDRQLEALARDSEARWSYTSMARMDGHGAEIRDPRIRPWHTRSGWIVEELLTFQVAVDTPTLLVERELVLEVGGFDPARGSWVTDYDLIFRLGLASPAAAVDEPLTWIRVHSGTHSADRVAAHRGWTELYGCFVQRVPDERLRRICRREARRHRLSLASRLVEVGRRRAALAEALPVLARRPWTPRAWRVVLWHILGKWVLNGVRAAVGARARGRGADAP
jgi:glycosyltransferase involved in cell wall biosynthesis